MAQTAVRLIEKNGALTYFHQYSTNTADPAKPWKGSSDTPVVTAHVPAVFVHPVSEGMRLGITGKSEDMEKRFSGFVLVCPVADIDMTKTMSVQRSLSEGKQFVEFVELLKPASVPLLYIFGIKR